MTLRSDAGRPIVYLHIGAMKTGTTYLQHMLYANRDELTAAGLVIPGETWGRQVRGVQEILGLGRRDPHVSRMMEGSWQALVDEALADPGNVSVISVEFLSYAGRRDVRRILASLAGADVRVILGVRDMAASLPSQWQTLVHNGGRWSWAEYLAAVPRPTARPLPRPRGFQPLLEEFHRTLNLPRMLSAWGPLLPPGALHVVTAPRSREQPDELWWRFAQVVGVDPTVVKHPPNRANTSLGQSSSELLRRLNLRIGRLPKSEYDMTVKMPVALGRLSRRARQEGTAQITREAYDVALRWNALTRRMIEQLGASVSGDLADLPTEADPRVRASLPVAPSAPHVPAILDAAEDAALVLARRTRRRRRKLAQAGLEVQVVKRPRVASLRSRWEATDDPVDAAARDLAARAREAALLLRRMRDEGLIGAAR